MDIWLKIEALPLRLFLAYSWVCVEIINLLKLEDETDFSLHLGSPLRFIICYAWLKFGFCRWMGKQMTLPFTLAMCVACSPLQHCTRKLLTQSMQTRMLAEQFERSEKECTSLSHTTLFLLRNRAKNEKVSSCYFYIHNLSLDSFFIWNFLLSSCALEKVSLYILSFDCCSSFSFFFRAFVLNCFSFQLQSSEEE